MTFLFPCRGKRGYVFHRQTLESCGHGEAVPQRNNIPSPGFRAQRASRHVGDLFEDLRDGHNLISLLEVLSGEHLFTSLQALWGLLVHDLACSCARCGVEQEY
ncbi:Plectin [Gryllus bimaculatus]|nr:Plectin [Gryllus bimaculatus]